MSPRRRRRSLPQEPISLEIESLSHEGRGVARIDGKVAFVDGALPGEKVLAKYVRKRGKFDELSVIEVEQASPDRVSSNCEYFGTCGGCSLRHVDPQAQIAFKENVLLEQLQHSANINLDQIEILPKILSDSQHYRRKARLAVRMVAKKGGALVGFREKYSTFITDMHFCQVLSSEVAKLIAPLREMITNLAGGDQIPQIEVAVGESASDLDSSGVVALIFRHLAPLSDSDHNALLKFAESHQCELYLQPGGPDTVHKVFPDQEKRLSYYLPDSELHLRFHPQDFTQVNAGINRQIVSRALEQLELKESDKVLDLFCGLGNFTLPIARKCAQVTGVEGSEEMVRRGYENAAVNGVTNAEFYCADLTKAVDASWWSDSFDKVVLDPPRSGALEILQSVVRSKPERIVYISCNPSTLARDAGELTKAGYKLLSAGVMDMFPHTTHVESMAVFSRQ